MPVIQTSDIILTGLVVQKHEWSRSPGVSFQPR